MMRLVDNRGIVRRLLSDVTFPRMALVEQNFPRPKVNNIPGKLRSLISNERIYKTIRAGMQVGITCGSRGIANMNQIIKEICSLVKKKGAIPFIIPSMGSHAGADAKEQRKLIESYGVTEDYCGAEIRSSMAVACIGKTEDGRDVFLDKNAYSADGIIVVGRIKAHTDFRGAYESGLLKMMVVGLGKQAGAETFHKQGPRNMENNLQLFGKAILKFAPIIFGVAIIENAYDETAGIEVLLPDEILEREPILLKNAKRLMAKSYISTVDVLIVDQIGKDISGDGMDPNITGRFCNSYISGGMNVKKIAILDLSSATNGQMVGLGYGDTTTMRCFQKCDLESSYPNALTSTTFSPFRIPLILPSDKDAIGACIKYCGKNSDKDVRIIRIHDTLHMSQIWVSENLLGEVKKNPNMKIITQPLDFTFDENGNLW